MDMMPDVSIQDFRCLHLHRNLSQIEHGIGYEISGRRPVSPASATTAVPTAATRRAPSAFARFF